MKRNHLSLRRKAGMLSAMAVGVLLVSSCAQDGFDDESWRSDVTNTQLESPAADDITIEASADGSQTIISWPVVQGAGGYLCSVYDVSNPDDPAVVGGVQDSLVDRCQLVVERAEDTNYMFSITTAGNEELNNAQAATATEVEFTSFTETYASIPAGTDISTWFDQNMPTEDTGEELCFDLEPGEEYTISKDIDFFDKRITLRTTSKTSPAKITLTGNASFMTSAGFTLKYVDFDCANSTAPFIKMSATPDPDILGVISGTNGYYDIQQPIIINTCNIDNLRGSLYTDNGVKYCVGTWLITNSVVHFNLDGTAIYLTMAAVFIAQACDVQMTLVQQLTLLAVLLLTSKGAAGVTGSGFIVLAATLSAVGHVPVAGLALILGIDRFMSEARAITNMIGNGIACIVVGHWLKEVDNDALKKTLGSSVSKEIKHAEDNVRDDPETIGVPADMHERAEHLDETHYGKEHPNK